MQPNGYLTILDRDGVEIWKSCGSAPPSGKPYRSNPQLSAELLVGSVGMQQSHENVCITQIRTRADLRSAMWWPSWCTFYESKTRC
ncbi:hypothetical protein BV898_13001 [Hypsibius exemplaris]|uniref:Uncharacterized protein n=1 Tax=Hypsibius exemplaris TaxID=2072580 RepID=A0A1W0WC84_HYPEX|nr:hypothetical protein BV898_13001 [Hypsibius exemplaris]